MIRSGISGKRGGGQRMWSLGWVVMIRLILSLVSIGYCVQSLHYGDPDRFYRPGQAIVILLAALVVNLALIAVGRHSRRLEQLIAFSYALDLVVLSRLVLASGGFTSTFIPFYLPILVMAAALLPGRLTALFPSIATLGAAVIGAAYAQTDIMLNHPEYVFFEPALLRTLPKTPWHTVVSTMLILSVLFFVVSYLSGVLSERLFMEQRLNEEVLSSMSEGVMVAAADGEILFENAEFLRLFPDSGGEKNCARLVAAIIPDADQGKLRELLDARSDHSLVVRSDGNPEEGRPPFEARLSSLRLGRDGDFTGILFLIQDLSLRKRMEKAERNLERTSAISTMAAGLTHEIRNPLASLRSAIQEIGDSFPEGSQNHLLAEVVLAESDRLDRVISRFLSFSREERIRLRKRRLGPLLEDILQIVRMRPDSGHLDLRIHCLADPEVECDSDRMAEIFLNLCLNALQALDGAQGTLDITVDTEMENGIPGVVVTFRDSGPGLSPQALDRMFAPFFSEKPNGTGMGLALSRKHVSLHNGELDGSNHQDGGALFRLWLPLTQRVLAPGARGGTTRYLLEKA